MSIRATIPASADEATAAKRRTTVTIATLYMTQLPAASELRALAPAGKPVVGSESPAGLHELGISTNEGPDRVTDRDASSRQRRITSRGGPGSDPRRCARRCLRDRC